MKLLRIIDDVHLVVESNAGERSRQSLDPYWPSLAAGFSITACERQFSGLGTTPRLRKKGISRRPSYVTCEACLASPHYLAQNMLREIALENARLLEDDVGESG